MTITVPTLLIAMGCLALAAGCSLMAIVCGYSFMAGLTIENINQFIVCALGLPGGVVMAVAFARGSWGAFCA